MYIVFDILSNSLSIFLVGVANEGLPRCQSSLKSGLPCLNYLNQQSIVAYGGYFDIILKQSFSYKPTLK